MSKKVKQTIHISNLINPNKAISSDSNKVIQWAELIVIALIMVTLIILHFIVLLNSGGLWRDEVATVNLVNMPTLVEMLKEMHHDAFPVLWLLILKGWIFIGLGSTDLSLRFLGLIVSLGVLGALWYVIKSLGMRLPMISLVLFALVPSIFFGDSLRAYGLGVLLILLSLGTMWRVLRNFTTGRMIACAISVLLSVHCLYHNSFLILAICVSAAVVGLLRRNWKQIAFALGLGLLVAVSVLPYRAIVSLKSYWTAIHKFPLALSWIFERFQAAIDPSGYVLTVIWAILAVITLISFIRLFIKADTFSEQKELAVYLSSTMLVSIIAYIVFIKILSYLTHDWYYLPLMAILAVIIDKSIDIICKSNLSARIVRILCVASVAVFIFSNSWNVAHMRRTNIDVLAVKLQTLAAKEDLIVVNPFYYGISFARYYHGSTKWITVPEMADCSIHRYDLFKDKMMAVEPIKTVLQEITATLQNGHHVWIVGSIKFLPPGETPVVIPPAPNSFYGWSEAAYEIAWSEEVAFALRTNGRSLKEIVIPVLGTVSEFEKVPLFVVSGWSP